MDITLPSSFEAVTSYDFTYKLEELYKSQESISFEFPVNVNAQPAGLLLMGSALRRLREVHEVSFKNINDTSYLGSMGFYQSIKEDKGKSIDQLIGNSKFIPITRRDILEMNKKEFYENNGSGNVYDIVERISMQITKILSNADQRVHEICFYSLYEIIRNVIEHSTKSVIWFSGQYWPTKRKVEIAILDEGCGILRSFSKSQKYSNLKSDFEAIQEAVKEGATCSVLGKRHRDEHDNSGYGLYKIKKLCELAGELAICSGKSAIIYRNNSEFYYDVNHVGTMISITLEYSNIKKHGAQISEILYPGRK